MTVPLVTRTKEEILLLAVSTGAATVVVASLARDLAPTPASRTAIAVALVLSLVTAFAFWFVGATRRALSESARRDDAAARSVLSALPEGLLVVVGGRVLSVNPRLCKLLGYERDELLGATAPFPFWPPEHRHEIERWHDALTTRREHVTQLVFSHRSGERIPVLVAGGRIESDTTDPRYVLTVRDVSASHRRERRLSELSTRDPETALLNQRGFEERLGEAVRQSLAGGGNVSVALLELVGEDGRRDIFGTPERLLAIERVQALVRAGEAVARVGDELAWILPDTDAKGAVKAVARAREELADLASLDVTAGVCDLATAGDALAVYALADRALAEARREGVGRTATYPSDAALGRGAAR